MDTPRNSVLIVLTIIIALLVPLMTFAASPPTAASTAIPGASSTFDDGNYNPTAVPALAGNITALTLEGISQTRSWQGYFGNITGTITLEDADTNTFYNWTAIEPRGFIYATLVAAGNPDWTQVVCFDHSVDGPTFDAYYTIANDDYDNVSNTYNVTIGDTGETVVVIDDDGFDLCPATYIYQNDQYQTDNFINYLLMDDTNAATGWIFGTIIEDKDAGTRADLPCYNGQDCDFQILVAEDGHGTDILSTNYYFWVDLSG